MDKNARRLIGLTGGIATGKSTVARYLADTYNLPILDADLYARKAVQVGSPILDDIFNRYGSQVKLADGSLNRKVLGEIIFNDSAEKLWLENKIHPYVRNQFQSQVEFMASKFKVIVLVIPLLFEAKMVDLVTETWVIYCSPEKQIERLIRRDNLTYQQAIRRIKNQLPIAEKVSKADVVLDNSSSLEFLYQQIDTALNNFGF